jgi:hypothetical protein
MGTVYFLPSFAVNTKLGTIKIKLIKNVKNIFSLVVIRRTSLRGHGGSMRLVKRFATVQVKKHLVLDQW